MSIEVIYPASHAPSVTITVERTHSSEVKLTLRDDNYGEELGFPMSAAKARLLASALLTLAHSIDGGGYFK